MCQAAMNLLDLLGFAAPPHRWGEPGMTTRLFLVRHGATVLSAEDRFAGATDVNVLERRQLAAPGGVDPTLGFQLLNDLRYCHLPSAHFRRGNGARPSLRSHDRTWFTEGSHGVKNCTERVNHSAIP